MPYGLLLKILGPVVILGGAWWWHTSQVNAVQKQLDAEIAAHAETKLSLAEFERAVNAAAAARTRAVADAVAESQRQFDEIIAHERELRAESDRLSREAAEEARRAEARLQEIRNDETNAFWADTLVPLDWLDWMQYDTTDPAALPPS